MESLIIENIEIKRGQRKFLELPVAKQFDYTDMSIPVEVIRGKEDGPIFFVSAAIHGDEINGVEVIRRLLSHRKLLSNLKGTLIAVPIVNVFGFNRNIRYLPDRRDLNRVFPGSPNGSIASQVAYKFMKCIVEQCDYGIDIHTGSAHRYNLAQIRASIDHPEILDLAKAFNASVILDTKIIDGSLRQAAVKKGVKMLLFEGGEALRYDEKIIRLTERGIISVLAHLNMLDADLVQNTLSGDHKREEIVARSSNWIRASHGGSIHMRKRVGNKVKKGDLLGVISDPLGKQKHYIKSRESGIIIGITMLPLVTNGDALFHIAHYDC